MLKDLLIFKYAVRPHGHQSNDWYTFLLRRELLEDLRKYQIEGIPPKVLESAHLKHSNRERHARKEGVDIGVTGRCPGHFHHGKLHDYIASNRK